MMLRFASYPITRTAASFAVTLMVLGAAAAAPAADGAGGGAVVGFVDAQNKTLFLHDFKGKPAVVNLWATWCAPCVAEMPSLSKLQQEYASQGLVVLALSEDESLQSPLAFYRGKAISNLVPYLDKGHAVWTALEGTGVPITVLIRRDGTMVQRIEGPVDWQSPQVRSLINEIIK